MLLEEIRKVFQHCNDVLFYRQTYPDGIELTIVYCRSLCDEQLINEMVLPEMRRVHVESKFATIDDIRMATTAQTQTVDKTDVLINAVFTGKAVIHFPHLNDSISLSIANVPERNTEQSTMDANIRGPRDGLVESLEVNVGLIRKRLPIPQLGLEVTEVGASSQTRVGLLYYKGKISETTLQEIRSRLRSIRNQVDELSSASQLEELISDHPFSLFPLSVYTGRTDFIINCLHKGRFVIMIDGVPGAMIAPASLFLLIKSPEDTHSSYFNANIGQILRLFSLLLSAFLPGFFIALTGYHQDQIPFPLLATVVMTRLGIPLSSPMEMFLVLFLLELFKEAGYRLPSMIGQTLTVVGGLIIGDSAVRAGLISPSLIVIGAISMVAGSTLISQNLTGTIAILRYISLLFASLLGMYGFLLSVLLLVVYVSGLTSFGVPFLAPITPLTLKDMTRAFLTIPRKLGGFVPHYMRRNNKG